MTDEQRREEFLRNPKKVINQAVKGKYKFLQKYYHRGAFYVSSMEDQVFQQDFAQPTLEDHFDKTKLPAVMQVRGFVMRSCDFHINLHVTMAIINLHCTAFSHVFK